MKKAALHNLGCKVNAYETEAMQQLLEEAGYEIVPFSEPADVYVVNTCTVTSMADKKSRQMLHRARSLSPDAIVVAAGCYVETGRTKLEKDPEVDLVLGNDQKGSLVARIAQFERERSVRIIGSADQPGKSAGEVSGTPGLSGKRRGGISGTSGLPECTGKRRGGISGTSGLPECVGKSISGISEESGPGGSESLFLTRTKEHTRAFLKVQDGCNRFCSYCIIPYARGRVRSRRTESVLREVEALAANGCREVVLTGIHLSSYGTDTGESLLQLIGRIHEVEGIRRIRLGSLEPGIVTEEFASKLSELPGLCPHFHLSLQSGCDATLRRMNRGYTAEEYERGCELLRKYFDHPAITTDVIVGFPGETDEEFACTERFLRRIQFYEMHVFKYSRREGTRAAVMPDQIPETVKSARSAALISAGEEMAREYRSFWTGKEREVLFEERVQLGGETFYVGYTKEYVKVACRSVEPLENCIRTGIVGGELSDGAYEFEKI